MRAADACFVLVFATVAAAVLCWGIAEARQSRTAWSAGALLMTIHALAAYGIFYGWSHHTAMRLTREQTAALTGIDFAGGIYVNYLFVSVWLFDAAWWFTAPASYARRPFWSSWAIRGFLFLIIVNGAIVFADGWARLVGTVAVLVAGAGVLRRGLRH